MGYKRKGYRNPCRSIVTDHLRMYKELREKGGERTQETLDVIDRVLAEYREDPELNIKYKAVEMMYLKSTHRVCGIANELHIDRSTVQKYFNEIIDRISKEAGFTRS